MTKEFWFVLLTFLMLSAIPSSAACGLYTYNDAYVDENDSVVADNYSQATCLQPNAYADAYVQVPSGATYGSSSTGSTSAEAVTASLTENDTGTGNIWGYNEASSACWAITTTASFGFPIEIDLAYSKSKWTGTFSNGVLGKVRCYETSWCTPETTPPTCNPSFSDQEPLIPGMQASCWHYYSTTWLIWRIKAPNGVWVPWECEALIPGNNAFGTEDSSLGSCTKK